MIREPKIQPLTEGQALLASKFIEAGGDKSAITDEIAKEAGYASKETARAALKGNTSLRAHLASYLDGAGATLEKSAQVISEAMDATEAKFFSFEGKVCDERHVVDHGTRLAAAKLNLEARGELKNGVNLTFNKYENLTDEQLAQIALGQQPPLLDQGLANP